MHELKLLFATNYSDSCFRAIRGVAQLADAFAIDITLVHASPSAANQRDLNSFFAEADHYRSCRRLALDGRPADVISDLAKRGHFDLIIAPGSDRLGLPRPFHRSMRAELLAEGAAPLWTTSRGLEEADFRRSIKTIAAGIDGWDRDVSHVELAASLAARLGARLRILTVVPPVDEGTMSSQAVRPQPLRPGPARERIEKLLCHWNPSPVIEVATGDAHSEFPRMAAKCEADLLFLSEAQSCGGLLRREISRTVNQSPCPVISIPNALRPSFRWSFLAKAARPDAAYAIPVPERVSIARAERLG